MGILLIIIALAVLIYYSFKGFNILFLSVLVSLGLVVATQLLNMVIGTTGTGVESLFALESLTGPFMTSTINYIGVMFLTFLVGGMYGAIMGESGASVAISNFILKFFGKNNAILAIVFATSLLTYGGVSLFVVVFAVYPIAKSLFKSIDLPKRIIPGAIALGAFTFTMTAMPGSPQAINVLPTTILGTNIYAAPIMGLIASVVLAGLGIVWLNYRVKVLAGEGYGLHPDDDHNETERTSLPSPLVAFTPIILVFVFNYVFTNVFFSNKDLLAMLNIEKVNGQWTVVLALGITILLSIFLFRAYLDNPLETLNKGASDSILPLFNTAAIIGFGGVVKSLAAFTIVKTWITGLTLPAIWKVAIATGLISGIVGSSSGGTGLALEILGTEFLSYQQLYGISTQIVHRVMLIAAGGLDSLPHCGAVISLLMVTKLTHKSSYLDIGICTVVIPIIALVVAIAVFSLTGIY